MFWRDIQRSARSFARAPLFFSVAVITLAVGISANSSVIEVMEDLFFHPPGIRDPDRLVALRVKYGKLNIRDLPISGPDFISARENHEAFSSVSISNTSDYTYSSSTGPERLVGAAVSWNWFETLGSSSLLGRTFYLEEDQPGTNNVVVLSYATWNQLFNRDRDVVGRTILLNRKEFRIVGVTQQDFRWPREAQIWLPLGLPPSEYAPFHLFDEEFFAVARLNPGVTMAQAAQSMQMLTNRITSTAGGDGEYAKDARFAIFAVPLMDQLNGNLRAPVLILLCSVGFILLITCASISGLVLVRTIGRAREFVIQTALGAGRWPLVRQVITESILIAVFGSMLGLGLTLAAVHALRYAAPDQALASIPVRVDLRIVFATFAAALLCALTFSIAPIFQVTGKMNFEPLRGAGQSSTLAHSRHQVRSALVVAQLSVALVLVFAAGTFLKNLARLEQVHLGFDPSGVMTAPVCLAYDDEDKLIEFYEEVTNQLSEQDGVQAAAAAYGLPFSGTFLSSSFSIAARPEVPGSPGPHSDLVWATPGYFSVMHIPLLRGRTFTNDDRVGTQPVVVIDENLAREYWPNENPVGQRVRRYATSPWAIIIGVVGHTDRSAVGSTSGKGVSYYSLFQRAASGAILIARTSDNPVKLVPAIRESVRSVDPWLAAPYDFETLQGRVNASLGPQRFVVMILGTFAAIALLLASLGLYGVINYLVIRRAREIGIRMALGAQSTSVLKLIFMEVASLGGIGIFIGALTSFAMARLFRHELPQIVISISTFATALSVLVMVMVAASYFPARRAINVDPVLALREQ